MKIEDIIAQLEAQSDLSHQEMFGIFEAIMSGDLHDEQIQQFLLAMNAKGPSLAEITVAAQVMRDRALKFDLGDGSHIDTCGTGGTGIYTFNCSTASAIVAAAGGAQVTKHGNKAVSSKSGSADFLIECGASIDHDRDKLSQIIDKVGFIFLFAPLHHQSMRHVMAARQKIKQKTIFNLLGPHTNPCSARRQIIGVYAKNLVQVFAKVAKALDMEHVLVVHGIDGVDEISITASTQISELRDGEITQYEIHPQDYGLTLGTLEDIYAESPLRSSQLVQEAFSGTESAVQNMIALNAGAGLYLAGKVNTIADGVELALYLMNSGKASETLEKYVTLTNTL